MGQQAGGRGAILYTEIGDVGVVSLNRPDQLNTFRHEDYDTLWALIGRVREAAVRALVITATGRAFSAGQDLGELDADKIADADEQQEILETLQDITRRLIALDIPTIVAFNGFAVGAGLEMALACDFRIAAPESYFMFAEAKRGLFPTNGVLWLLPRLVGLAHAREMLLSGRKFDADYALRVGLVHEVVPAADLSARAIALATELAENAPATIAGVKALLRETFDISLASMMQREVEYNRAITGSADFAEGVSAFLEKRKPNFRR
ncbi:MAG TPA: enoyl-CoA hydratase/isomerase family protein [Verrucomicrobiae bacterium]|nr:enoyl-CoA hydratase/isomerase family protein [Verrucomicrobiae bacterium]